MPLSSGDILGGHYRIEAEIGRGAYGRVYRARDTKLDRPVAIKELARGMDELGSSAFSDYVRRFEREARVQAGFNHPNIVHVYELIQEGADRLYVVMELVDGESLRDLLARRGPLPADEAIRVTADILAGLAVVHADPRDIVHRDIKPSNVLLTKGGQAKLADFGLAQVGDESMRSGAGQPHPGTQFYMSPEQSSTSDYLYPASDLFGVGCVLFEMLTGVPYKRAQRERQPLAELRPDAPPWLGEIMAAALAKDPDDRPLDAAEMGRLLAEARAKVEAEARTIAETEERERQEAQRKAEAEAERARLAEQERRQRTAAEQARIAGELQASAEAQRKSAEESQRRLRTEEAERARQEAARRAQAEADATRREKREQDRRTADEREQFEEEHAVARSKMILVVVGIIAVLALIVLIRQPWAGEVRLGAAPTTAFTPSFSITSLSEPTETQEPTRAPEPTVAPAAQAAPIPTASATASDAPSAATRVPPTPTSKSATLTPAPSPGFTVESSSAVNVRSGPGTNYSVIGQLKAGSQQAVTGRTAAGDWWQFDFNGRQGWVSDQVVKVDTEARTVAVITAPPSPTPQPASSAKSPIVSPIDGMRLVHVPAGDFLMGSNDSEDEKPQHKVYLDAFWIDQYEVSNAGFRLFVDSTGYRTEAELGGRIYWYNPYTRNWGPSNGETWLSPTGPESNIDGRDQYPVVMVSWQDAEKYCAWAGRRLPTEAEWEKAARGTDGRRWPWGDQALDNVRANIAFSINDLTEVGNYSPLGDSPYGVADMAGNVWEWVADWYDANFYASSPNNTPIGPSSGNERVLRGGAWDVDKLNARTATRFSRPPSSWNVNIGFRCARSD